MGTIDVGDSRGHRTAGRWVAALLTALVVAATLTGPQARAAELPPGGTFVDDDGSVHEGAIEAIAAAGVTSGCTADLFCPSRLLTRAEMAAFLARSLGLAESPTDRFGDDAGHLFESEINAIAEAGITLGCAPDAFCPNETMSRGQMASFLLRAFDLSASPTDWFLDDADSVHHAAINALAEAGITDGCGEVLFCPLSRVRRDQMASFLARAMGLPLIVPPPRTPQLCRTAPAGPPTGEFLGATGSHPPAPGAGSVWTYRVEVENGLGVDPDCFAASVELILTDPEDGWGRSGARSFERIESGSVDVIVTLASPSTTDAHCLPLITGGIFSCWNGSRAMVNSWRWEFGASAYDDVAQYRIYLVNHEVGHGLGFGHRSCTGAGDPAPVMMQQTKGVGSCRPDPWPEDFEL